MLEGLKKKTAIGETEMEQVGQLQIFQLKRELKPKIREGKCSLHTVYSFEAGRALTTPCHIAGPHRTRRDRARVGMNGAAHRK